MRKHRTNRKRSQKMYKMRGCNKSKNSRRKSYKYLGGKGTNVFLAYPSKNVPTINNPNLAYTGKGGFCGTKNSNLAYNPRSNTNGGNPLYPSTGPNPTGFNFLNTQMQRGGDCGCNKMLGGGGLPPPFVGSPWSANTTNSNYFAMNKYPTDVQTEMKAVGANPPFLGGKRRSATRKKRGGGLTNTLAQDLINAGRQFGHGFSNLTHGIRGLPQTSNPLPWKGQIPRIHKNI
jgi:hypothetical protein